MAEGPDTKATLDEADLDPDPVVQFQRWFEAARAAGVAQPDAMALATAGADGRPDVRMVLLKAVDDRGFVFYSNHASAKARDLEANPTAALVFHWQPQRRQVRVSGSVTRVPREESERYFATRPRGAQVAAWASAQSEVIPDREHLDRAVRRVRAEFEGREIPLPDGWGGFRLRPESIEFWQGREDRLHDRLRYARGPDGGWRIERLAP